MAMSSPARTEQVELFDLACPHVVGNPFVVHWPHPKQAEFLSAHLRAPSADKRPFECLYGGAAGGGKSDALLMAAAQYAWKFPHFRAVLLRRTFAELAKAGALMDRALHWWLPRGVHWDGTNKVFRFPNGARVEFGYHDHPTDDTKFHGGEWHFVGFDELTHWPDDSAYMWLRSRLRKGDGDPIPLRLLSGSNPGGPGHVWVKNRFIGGVDPATGRKVEPQHLYIPATLDDNPSLDRAAYWESLSDMHPTRRAQLRDGDWSAREPGDYFRVEWFGPLLDPEIDALPRGEHIAIRWWDLAASESKDAARTAGVLMARLRQGVRVVLHSKAFRATPGKRDAMIVQQAHTDGRAVVVGIEIEGGSGGPAQFEALAKRLQAEGFRVVGARPRVGKPDLSDREKATMTTAPRADTGKEARADPVASCCERGYQRRGECPDSGEPWWGVDAGLALQFQRDGLRLMSGPWTQDYVDELEGFPTATLKDQVDATSGAWAWLEAHGFGNQPAAAPVKPRIAVEHDAHPDERDAAEDRPKRWRP